MKRCVLAHHGDGTRLRGKSEGGGRPQSGKGPPAGRRQKESHRKSQQPPAHLALRPLHAARAPLIKPQSISADDGKCRTIRPLTNGLGMYFRSTWARSLERVEIQPLKP